VRDGQGDPAAGPARVPDHLRRARRRASHGRPAEPLPGLASAPPYSALAPPPAAAARQNLAGFEVEIVQGQFEKWQPAEPASLVYAATAWHWIDPAVRYQRAWRALRPGGHLALWEAVHVFADGGDPFLDELQDIYDEIGEGRPPSWVSPRAGELPDDRAGIEASGLFKVTGVRQYDWERAYSAEEYIGLLSTFSGHIAMAEWKRRRLYGEIRRRLSLRRDHSVRRHWGAVLQVAQRKD
jgi:SAM-dependent methyltransferase